MSPYDRIGIGILAALVALAALSWILNRLERSLRESLASMRLLRAASRESAARLPEPPPVVESIRKPDPPEASADRRLLEDRLERHEKLLANLLEQQRRSNEFLFLIARCEKSIAQMYRGRGYDEVDDEKERFLERVSELTDRYHLPLEEAEQRARSEIGNGRPYSREGLGLDR